MAALPEFFANAVESSLPLHDEVAGPQANNRLNVKYIPHRLHRFAQDVMQFGTPYGQTIETYHFPIIYGFTLPLASA